MAYEVYKTKNYRKFAKELEEKTGCQIIIKELEKDHHHYQFNDKYGMSLGVLCIQEGVATFAPLVTENESTTSQYLDISHFVRFEDLFKVISVFNEMFVD